MVEDESSELHAKESEQHKQVIKAIRLTLEADLKSKGVGVKSANQYHILQDLLVNVFAA